MSNEPEAPFVPLRLLPGPAPEGSVPPGPPMPDPDGPDRLQSIQFIAAVQKSKTGAVVSPVVVFVATSARGRVAKAVLPVPWLRQNHYPMLLALEGAVNRALVDVAAVEGLAVHSPPAQSADPNP